MENKLIAVLKLLSAAQIRSLRDFLVSPYFNKNETLTHLLFFVIDQLHIQNIPSDEQIFTHLFADETFDKTKISKLRYKAFLLVEKFLQQQIAKNRSLETSLWLLSFYADNNLTDEFDSLYQKVNEQQNIENERNSEFYYLKFVTEEAVSRRITQNQDRHLKPNFDSVEESLNIFFIIRKLELACNTLSRSKLLNEVFQPDLLLEVVRYIEENVEVLQHPAINVYYHLYQMLKDTQNVQNFHECHQVITEYENAFPLKERKNFHTYLRNYCIAKINEANKEFESLLFQLYEQQLQNGTLFNEKGEILHTNFKNIVILALRLNELTWTANFIETYKNNLANNIRQETYQYCLAKLYFTQKQYEKVLNCLHNADFQDIFQNIAARRLMMITYFELNETTSLEAALNSFRVFLHRNQTIAENHKTAYRNFANFLRKLSELPPARSDLRKKLLQNIEKTALVSEKDWLLEKVKAD